MAETKPLRIKITQGVIKPMPIALAQFSALGDSSPAYVDQITSVIMADLVGSGLFRATRHSLAGYSIGDTLTFCTGYRPSTYFFTSRCSC